MKENKIEIGLEVKVLRKDPRDGNSLRFHQKDPLAQERENLPSVLAHPSILNRGLDLDR